MERRAPCDVTWLRLEYGVQTNAKRVAMGGTVIMGDRTRFEALLASTEREIKEIAERQGSLAERLDRSEARLDQCADLLGQVAIHVAVLDARVNALETRGHGVETQVHVIETRIDAFAAEVKALDAKLDVRAVDAPERTEHIERTLRRGGRARPERRQQRSASKRRTSR
jgi:chromosome segregation ATPase